MKFPVLFFVVLLQALLINVSIVIERFHLVITKEILPGYSKKQVTVNGTVPGPTINITVGNWVEVI